MNYERTEENHFYAMPFTGQIDGKEDIIEIFGSKVFNLTVMRKRLPKHIYDAMLRTMRTGTALSGEVAEVVANAMKDWALEQGATHYTHWFQPMTGVTAEKHDAFITPTEEGKVIMEFSGKELIKGESDASSFPSGGLRATFEARGYTAWDPTSYAFVKGTTLYIPTTFVSYSGEVLDKKTPLLRSMEALSDSAVRMLRLFGKDVKKVFTTVGAEQEYFLIPKEMYVKRKDLIFTGRTLFGAPAPKGQEMDDHYYGRIRENVCHFMRDVDRELWSLGIPSKTRHNEAAPAQHELAPVFSIANQSADNNHLIMDVLERVAAHHNLVCLLHEKPFEGVNGSGKHNNWAMSTDTGENLLDPGDDPAENLQFMTFLVAVIEAVDRYPELLRSTVASAGNDHRLGASEAPPAIVSIFLGDLLTAALKTFETGEKVTMARDLVMDLGVDSVPNFVADATDRNRTSPFAFTGNKFEFRMLGAHQSIAGPNIALNTIVAEVLGRYADFLECSKHFEDDCKALLREALKAHKRIVFNGNNYADDWVREAKRRGLPNLATTPEAFEEYASNKNLVLMEKHGIYTKAEMIARKDIHLEEYCKTIRIEARTMITMVRREIVPGVMGYMKDISQMLWQKKSIVDYFDISGEEDLLRDLSEKYSNLLRRTETLEEVLHDAKDVTDGLALAYYYRDEVIPAMQNIRILADYLEQWVGAAYWPYPIYEDMLFYV